MTEAAIKLTAVKRRLGRFLLDIPEFELERGSVLGLVGENGAGKSTTLNIILNLIYPDSGRVQVLGLDQPAAEVEIKRRTGYLAESPSYYENVAIRHLVGLMRAFYPTWDERLYAKYLGKFKLDPSLKVRELSKGMKVKLGLTLALSHQPELLILDEPTSGIDPVIRLRLLEEIMDLIKDERRTVVFSSHITQDVEKVADYVAIMQDGRIVQYADKETLHERWRKVTGITPERDAGPSSVSSLFLQYKSEGRSFVGITDRCCPDWLRRLAAAGATDVQTIPMGLDEVLVQMSRPAIGGDQV